MRIVWNIYGVFDSVQLTLLMYKLTIKTFALTTVDSRWYPIGEEPFVYKAFGNSFQSSLGSMIVKSIQSTSMELLAMMEPCFVLGLIYGPFVFCDIEHFLTQPVKSLHGMLQ